MDRKTSVLAAAFLAAWAAPSRAEEDEELEQLIKAQGDQIRQMQEEIEQLKSRGDQTMLERDISEYLAQSERTSVDFPRLRGGGTRNIRLGGYFSIEFRDDGDGATMEFDQHRLVLMINANVAPGLTFNSEIEIEGGGADVGFLEDNEILVEYAELGYEILEYALVFKAGALLVPWGRFNQYHDDPFQDLTDRPLVARRLAAVAFDQPGVGFEGTAELGGDWFVDWDVALTQGWKDNITTNGGVRDARQSFRSDNNENKQFWARVVFSVPVRFLDVLEVGGSGAFGKHDNFGHQSNYGYGLELFAKKGPFQIIAEYMNWRFNRDGSQSNEDFPRRSDGWYLDINYHFFPDSWRGSHKLLTQESTFTLVLRLEAIDLNHATTGSTFRDDLQQITFGFNFRPVERSVFKLSYTLVDSKQLGFERGSRDRFVMSWASYF